jgi:hypothetical protein
MHGPRKVRVFRDPKKSPNWYVEWRDMAGRRHCESCGADEREAQERARQIRAEFRRWREAASPIRSSVVGQPSEARSKGPTKSSTPDLRLHAFLRYPQFEIPVDLHIEINSDFINALGALLSTQAKARSAIPGTDPTQ